MSDERGGYMVSDGDGTRWYDDRGRLVGRDRPFRWKPVVVCLLTSAVLLTIALCL